MKEELYQIILSNAVAGIIIKNDIVIKAAPIFDWMIGKNINQIKMWVYNKQGKINKIK